MITENFEEKEQKSEQFHMHRGPPLLDSDTHAEWQDICIKYTQ